MERGWHTEESESLTIWRIAAPARRWEGDFQVKTRRRRLRHSLRSGEEARTVRDRLSTNRAMVRNLFEEPDVFSSSSRHVGLTARRRATAIKGQYLGDSALSQENGATSRSGQAAPRRWSRASFSHSPGWPATLVNGDWVANSSAPQKPTDSRGSGPASQRSTNRLWRSSKRSPAEVAKNPVAHGGPHYDYRSEGYT